VLADHDDALPGLLLAQAPLLGVADERVELALAPLALRIEPVAGHDHQQEPSVPEGLAEPRLELIGP
jgi:hypothetical protein